jgi:adenine-specific DNA-methyltransferase
MAKIEDLIAQIPDARLKKAIGAEVQELKKNKRFGLVFEEHLPETVRVFWSNAVGPGHWEVFNNHRR